MSVSGEVSSNFKTLPFIFKERIEDMAIPEYPPNSNKSKQENSGRKIPEAIVDIAPPVRKKKENKYLRLLFAQDFKDIKDDLVKEYVEPKAKELFWSFIQAQIDYVTNALRMMVYKGYKPVDKSKLPAERYSYNNYYTSPSAAPRAPSMETEINYDEFKYGSEAKAKEVLNALKGLIVTNGAVSVLDLYRLSNVTTSNYAIDNYGWTNLDFVETRFVNDGEQSGWVLNLPRAKPLNWGT